MKFYHRPVLVSRVLEGLALKAGGIYIDGTLGGGGHSEAILSDPRNVSVIGIDQDDEALTYAGERLQRFGARFTARKSNFRDLDKVIEEMGVGKVNGVLLDIGISSWHVDEAGRGFSFLKEGPLDMRMNRSQELTAAEIVQTSSEEELVRVFREYGEEPLARPIARAIVNKRKEKEITTTTELAQIIEDMYPKKLRVRGIHPGTRIFQALRIEVNDELGALREGLEKAEKVLAKGGRMAVITFHSLEDRIVKNFIRDRSSEYQDTPELPNTLKNIRHTMKQVTRKPERAEEEELQENPRARSAKLRVAEKTKE
ncbi:MAG: 16S rRNA (cytosine(1402)-N(4))-methyltransferase RsmH [Verrucomicrobiota bacterium]|nr:16S rRNA (cytosine(1402)-N(4))-methyltransferase RsmH [Verrucomicrobiota bacterium]